MFYGIFVTFNWYIFFWNALHATITFTCNIHYPGMVGKLLSGSTRKSFREDVFQQQAPGTYFNIIYIFKFICNYCTNVHPLMLNCLNPIQWILNLFKIALDFQKDMHSVIFKTGLAATPLEAFEGKRGGGNHPLLEKLKNNFWQGHFF